MKKSTFKQKTLAVEVCIVTNFSFTRTS